MEFINLNMRKKIQQKFNQNKGIGYMLLSSLCFAILSALAKHMNATLPSIELVFFRSAVGLPFLFWSLWRRPPVDQKGGKFFFLLYRGLVGAFTMYCLFYALEHLGLSLTNTYGQAFPLFIALFTYLWLPNESLSSKQILYLLMGFLGMVVIFRPDAQVSWEKHSIGIIYAAGTALGYIAIKEAQKYYDSRWVIVSFMACGFFASVFSLGMGTFLHLPASFWVAQWVQPSPFEWVLALILGLLALGVQGFATLALRNEATTIVGAVGNSSVLFSILIEIVLGRGLPDGIVLIGMVLVIWGSIQVTKK